MTIRQEEIIRDKILFFKDKDVAIHISLKENLNGFKKFYNGKTIEIKEKYIVFIDDKLGEILIALSEISDVDRRANK